MTNKNLYIVTGSSSGIGKELIIALTSNSDNFVIGIARNNQFSAPNYLFFNIDLNEIIGVKNFIFPDINSYHSVHLINNAGTLGEINTLDKIDLDNLENIITVNYTSAMILATKFIQKYQNEAILKTIINISSGAATSAYASWSNYCASKAALEMFSKCINVEQAALSYPIYSYSIAPGVVDTSMQAYIRDTDIQNFAMKPKFEDLFNDNKLFKAFEVAAKIIDVTINPEEYSEKVFRIQF